MNKHLHKAFYLDIWLANAVDSERLIEIKKIGLYGSFWALRQGGYHAMVRIVKEHIRGEA